MLEVKVCNLHDIHPTEHCKYFQWIFYFSLYIIRYNIEFRFFLLFGMDGRVDFVLYFINDTITNDNTYVIHVHYSCVRYDTITNKRDCAVAVKTNAITVSKWNSTTQTYINKAQVCLSNRAWFNIYLDEPAIAAIATYVR